MWWQKVTTLYYVDSAKLANVFDKAPEHLVQDWLQNWNLRKGSLLAVRQKTYIRFNGKYSDWTSVTSVCHMAQCNRTWTWVPFFKPSPSGFWPNSRKQWGNLTQPTIMHYVFRSSVPIGQRTITMEVSDPIQPTDGPNRCLSPIYNIITAHRRHTWRMLSRIWRFSDDTRLLRKLTAN